MNSTKNNNILFKITSERFLKSKKEILCYILLVNVKPKLIETSSEFNR